MFACLAAGVLLAQSIVSIDLAPGPGPLDNPGKGLVFPATATSSIPNTLELREYKLSEVVIGPDEYDFSQIDADLADSFERGKRVVLRIRSAQASRADAIPQHMVELGELKRGLLQVAPNISTQPIAVPDYSNPAIVLELVKFIFALGDEFDEDLRIAYIVDGLLGRGVAEEQSIPEEFFAPRESVLEIAKAYDEAFDVTMVLMNDPVAAKESSVGLFDGRFAENTLDYGIEEFDDSLEARLSEHSLVDLGKFLPVGGVLPLSIRESAWERPTIESAGIVFAAGASGSQTQGVVQSVEGVHATFVIAPFLPSPLDETTRTRIEDAIRKMGYQFRVTRVQVETTPETYDVTFEVINEGSAPIFIPAGILFALIDDDGAVTPGFAFLGRSIMGLGPGEMASERLNIPKGLLEESGSTLAIGIIADESETPSVRFANATQDQDAEGWLTLLDFDELPTVQRQ